MVMLKHNQPLLDKHMDIVKQEIDNLEKLKLQNTANNNEKSPKSGIEL